MHTMNPGAEKFVKHFFFSAAVAFICTGCADTREAEIRGETQHAHDSAAHQKEETFQNSTPKVVTDAAASAFEPLPLPHNRIRNFYAAEARRHLNRGDRPLPEILPEFPGLDGGKFGHWGQGDDTTYADERLNEMDLGGLVSQVVHHFGQTTVRGVAVVVGENQEASALF